MKGLDVGRYALGSCVAAAMLVGCGGSQPPIGAPGAMAQRAAPGPASALAHRMTEPSYQVMYRFRGPRKADGSQPSADLIDDNGTFYGTTTQGGNTGCGGLYDGCGTVYSINASGTEKVLHVFAGSADGTIPRAGLIDVNGTLYGTTSRGGQNNYGTVFSISTSGTENVLHSFTGADGAYPQGDLIVVDDTLYGTTVEGGTDNNGTVYSITMNGNLRMLHSFSGAPDGANPLAGLTNVKGTLYGTTAQGGLKCGDCGTVFRISTTGQEKVLHKFSFTPDGGDPQAALIDVNGTLYGTTFYGGSGCGSANGGCGTVFSISTTGKEKVLYNFTCCSDGRAPVANLTDVDGSLYGTTFRGGGVGCGHDGCGTIFSVSTAGSETLLYKFTETRGGRQPAAGLVDVNGTLYGTTENGGFRCFSGFPRTQCGTVFAFTP